MYKEGGKSQFILHVEELRSVKERFGTPKHVYTLLLL